MTNLAISQGATMDLLVTDIKKKYAQVTAIKQLSFTVNKGEIFALLGPNGAGKSSLIRMLTGFTQPDSGSICLTIEGTKYSSIPSEKLGYLPEDRGLYPEKSILKNLIYFAQLNGMNKKTAVIEADYWLSRFDLLARKNVQLKTLSKGNQQKVQLITAVIHHPQWVILDEPFSGLDPINQEKVVEFLIELKTKGMTVILSAHQMAMVEKLADRMLLMNAGEALLYGSLAQIQQQVSTSAHLSVQFAEPIIEQQVHSHLSSMQYTITEPNKITLKLPALHSMNELLTKLTSLGELQAMYSKKVDLHQLYLDAISQHGVINNAQ